MYIQLTTRCNMKCAHCCFAATRKGTDMEFSTFVEALDVAEKYGDSVTLGGGEPTLHPQFFRWLKRTLEMYEFEIPVFVVTNGRNKAHAMRLLRMVMKEFNDGVNRLNIALSQDEWHDPIDYEVVSAYREAECKLRSMKDGRVEVRTVTRIAPVGRGRHSDFDSQRAICACSTPLVDPEGNVWACGCKKVKVGTIFESGVLKRCSEDPYHS